MVIDFGFFLSPFIIRIRSLHIFIKKSASRYSFVQLRSMFTGAPPDDYTVIKIPLIYQKGESRGCSTEKTQVETDAVLYVQCASVIKRILSPAGNH